MQIDQYIRTILFFTVNIKNPLFWVSAKHVCFLNVAFMAWLYLFSSWLFRGFNTTFFSRTCVHVCYYSFMFHLFIWNRFASRIEMVLADFALNPWPTMTLTDSDLHLLSYVTDMLQYLKNVSDLNKTGTWHNAYGHYILYVFKTFQITGFKLKY